MRPHGLRAGAAGRSTYRTTASARPSPAPSLARRGKADAERKAEKWLKDHTTSEKTRVDVFLDQYTDYLKETKSKSHASQYSGFIRLYIQPVIGVFRMNKLTEGDLQTVIDLAYSKNNLADKTLRDVRAVS